MSRPRRCRWISQEPNFDYFKPAGIGLRNLKESILTVDEYEAVRLKDLLTLDQKKCAEKMNISQPTFHRLVLSARKKIADAIVHGKAIRIQGGAYKMPNKNGKGPIDKGQGRYGRKSNLGATGTCKCPKCGYEEPKNLGQPCLSKECPKCGTTMMRGQ